MEHGAQKKPLNAGGNPDRVTLGLGLGLGSVGLGLGLGLGLGSVGLGLGLGWGNVGLRLRLGEGQVVHVPCHRDILREYVYTAMSFILDRVRLNLGDLA